MLVCAWDALDLGRALASEHPGLRFSSLVHKRSSVTRVCAWLVVSNRSLGYPVARSRNTGGRCPDEKASSIVLPICRLCSASIVHVKLFSNKRPYYFLSSSNKGGVVCARVVLLPRLVVFSVNDPLVPPGACLFLFEGSSLSASTDCWCSRCPTHTASWSVRISCSSVSKAGCRLVSVRLSLSVSQTGILRTLL